MVTLENFLTVTYIVAEVAGVLLFVPQGVAALRSRDGCRDLSLLSWGFWAFGFFVATLYAGLVARDTPFLLMQAFNFVGVGTIFSIALCRRLTQPAIVADVTP